MTPATTFELVSFESVPANRRSVLLRLRAIGGPVSLLADDGRRVRELAWVPGPAPEASSSRAWSGAFVADSELFDRRPVFAARLEDGTLVDLPAPQERPARPGPAAADHSGAHLSEARRQALLVVQRDLDAERASHAQTATDAQRMRLELTRSGSIIGQLGWDLEQSQAEAEEAKSALDLAQREVSRLNTALTTTQAEASEREERAVTQLIDLAARLETETARHIASTECSAEESAALEAQLAAARSALEHERETIVAMSAEAVQVAAARDTAEQRLSEHREALTLYAAALDLQMEEVATAEEEIYGLQDEREADTQAVLRLVRSARANDVGESPADSPFSRWEETRHRLAQWAGGEADAEDATPEPAAEDRAAQS